MRYGSKTWVRVLLWCVESYCTQRWHPHSHGSSILPGRSRCDLHDCISRLGWDDRTQELCGATGTQDTAHTGHTGHNIRDAKAGSTAPHMREQAAECHLKLSWKLLSLSIKKVGFEAYHRLQDMQRRYQQARKKPVLRNTRKRTAPSVDFQTSLRLAPVPCPAPITPAEVYPPRRKSDSP